MTYKITVPLEVTSPLSESDPDVRSVRRLPGFVGLDEVAHDTNRYELTIEVEGGSLRDASDAAEELLLDYESALDAYRPRLLEAISPELR